jgi:hypothetical protein
MMSGIVVGVDGREVVVDDVVEVCGEASVLSVTLASVVVVSDMTDVEGAAVGCSNNVDVGTRIVLLAAPPTRSVVAVGIDTGSLVPQATKIVEQASTTQR